MQDRIRKKVKGTLPSLIVGGGQLPNSSLPNSSLLRQIQIEFDSQMPVGTKLFVFYMQTS